MIYSSAQKKSRQRHDTSRHDNVTTTSQQRHDSTTATSRRRPHAITMTSRRHHGNGTVTSQQCHPLNLFIPVRYFLPTMAVPSSQNQLPVRVDACYDRGIRVYHFMAETLYEMTGARGGGGVEPQPLEGHSCFLQHVSVDT